jgi:hypothetical protein
MSFYALSHSDVVKVFGQAGRKFNIMHKEYIIAIRNSNSNVGYVNRILSSGIC